MLAPPLPGIGQRILTPDAMREFWYQPFHRLDLAERLIDGDPGAVRAYLRHFWEHWSGPAYEPAAPTSTRSSSTTARPARSSPRSTGTGAAPAASP